MAKLIITKCGCVSIANISMLIVDGDKIPELDPYIGWIEFDGTRYYINESFINLTLMLDEFNINFVETNNFHGVFSIENDNLYYSNPENFTTAEIMVQYGLKHLIFRIGTLGEVTSNPAGYTAELDPDNEGILSISHTEMLNLKEVSVMTGNSPSEAVASQHTYEQVDPDDATKGKITFASLRFNENVYLTFSQTAP